MACRLVGAKPLSEPMLETSPPQADFDWAEKIRPILLTFWLSLISSKIQIWEIIMPHF